MSVRGFRHRAVRGARAVALLAALVAAAPVLAQQGQQRIAGDVVSLDGRTLTVRSKLGQTVALKVQDNPRVTVRVPARWTDISTGSYVGTTAVPQPDGTLLAKEVHLFTEAQRGTAEGHFPMSTPGDTMTNATVSSLSSARARDTTTNATVAAFADAAGSHRLTLTYKGGEKVVVVPPSTPIVRSEPGDRTLLVPGTHVVAYARRDDDGSLALERVSVGRNGFEPPI